MFTDFFLLLIVKTDLYLKGSCIGRISLLALLDRILYVILTQLEVNKFKA